jgi:hypothetical protein
MLNAEVRKTCSKGCYSNPDLLYAESMFRFAKGDRVGQNSSRSAISNFCIQRSAFVFDQVSTRIAGQAEPVR